MATETIFADGTFSGTGWTGTGGDIDEGISAADGNEISSDSDGEGDVLTIDFADVVTIVDADTVTDIEIVTRGRVTNDGGDESFQIDLLVSGSPINAVLGPILTNTHTTGNHSNAAWDADKTVTQLNSMQVTLDPGQSGMPTPNTWHLDTAEIVITFTPSSSGPSIPLLHHYYHNTLGVR